MLEIKAIFTFVLLREIMGFFNNYSIEDMTFNVSGIGKATMEFGIIIGKFKQGYNWNYKPCNPSWSGYCSTRFRFYGVTFNAISLPTYVRYREVLHKSMLKRKPHKDIWIKEGVFMSNEFLWDGPDWANVIINAPMHVHDIEYYLKVLCICFLVTDRHRLGEKHLMNDCKFAYFYKPEIRKVFMSKYQNSLLETFLQVKCRKNYYQSSCWQICVPVDNKYTCDEEFGEKCLTFWEPVRVKYTYWVPKDEFENWEQLEHIMDRCMFYNPCAKTMEHVTDHCPNNGHCYPLSNGTFTCLKFIHTYKLLYYPSENYTLHSLIKGDYLLFKYEITGQNAQLFLNLISCRWVRLFHKWYNAIYVSSNGSVLWISETVKFGKYHFSVECDIASYRVLTFEQYYYIYEMPEKIFLSNLSLGNDVDLFIGQDIMCLSDTNPKELAILVLEIDSDNFRVPSHRIHNHVIIIPLDAITGFSVLSCKITFNFPDERTSKVYIQSFSFMIKSYISFHWLYKSKNIYNRRDFASCQVLAYFIGQLSIKILSGPGTISIESAWNFTTKATRGGHYYFLCILAIKDSDIMFYRRNNFEIYQIPDEICLLLSYPTLGSYLRCGHNGYPADLAAYDLSLSISNASLARSKTSFIKIPYFIKQFEIHFSCQIIFKMNKESTKLILNKNIQLDLLLSKIVTVDKKDSLCSIYVDHPFENMHRQLDSKLMMFAVVHILHPFPESFEDTHVMFTIMFFVIAFHVFIMIMIGRPQYMLKHYRLLFVRRRFINDKLMFQTKFINVAREGTINMYVNKLIKSSYD